MRVTVWCEEFKQGEEDWERELEGRYSEARDALYPDGIHSAIADGLRERLGDKATVLTASHDQPEHGLGAEALDSTDVLLWWSHSRSHLVDDEVADRVYQRVLGGMGLIVLHAALDSKPFKRLMGTSCVFARWRQGGDREAVWTVKPSHPIARGVQPAFVIPEEEAFSEYFDIPEPDELVFVSSFSGGEIFRSGCCFVRGNGRIFYFRPGHEAYPTYYQPEVLQVIANAVEWAHVDTPSLTEYYAIDWPEREGRPGWFTGDDEA